MINKELLLQTMQDVEEAAKVGLWDQKHYASKAECGTAFCFAGHCVNRLGYKPDFTWAGIYTEEAHVTFDVYPKEDRDVTFIADIASKALGLDTDQACNLFSSLNTLENLRDYVADLVSQP